MISNILINVDKIEYLDDYRKVGISTFLFPLEGFCVGYNTYNVEEINKVEVSKKYILINRVLDSISVDDLREILPKLKANGFVFEDIAIYMLVKNLNLDVELILFQNHFQNNIKSVNFWLDRVDSVFIGNEITKKEIIDIVNNSKKEICVHLYGYNQVMYSRRKLLTNWSEEFNVPYKNENIIVDRATKVKFRALENEYGTVMYSDKIFNGSSLLKLPNIKYFYVNTMLVSHDIIMDFLSNMDSHSSEAEDNGFLEKETIYKLKEVPR